MDERLKANLGKECSGTRARPLSDVYDVAGFKAGRSQLHDLVLAELRDVRGKSLLHLQCHFGLDTMSWARLGAVVTGLGFSDQAIKLARSLAAIPLSELICGCVRMGCTPSPRSSPVSQILGYILGQINSECAYFYCLDPPSSPSRL